MKKLNNSIIDLVNDESISIDTTGMNAALHNKGNRLLVGDPSKSIGEIGIERWSPNTEYVQIVHIESGETMWVHKKQLYVMDVLKDTDVFGNKPNIYYDDSDIEGMTKHWGDKFDGKPTTGLGTQAGYLTGIGVAEIDSLLPKDPESSLDRTPPTSDDIPSNKSVYRYQKDHIGTKEIKGIFPSISDMEVTLQIDEHNSVIKVTDEMENTVHNPKELCIILDTEGQIHLIEKPTPIPTPPKEDITSKDGMKAGLGTEGNPINLVDFLKEQKTDHEGLLEDLDMGDEKDA